jgi:hypothetical protein
MKTLLTSAALAAMVASSASATTIRTGVATWGGSTNNLGPACDFIQNDAGVMEFDESTMTWTTTTAAIVRIKTRLTNDANNDPVTNNIKVEAAKKDGVTLGEEVFNTASGSTEVHAADIKYNASGNASTVVGPAGYNAASVNVNDNNINIGSTGGNPGVYTINISGTAKITDSNAVLNSNADYRVNHLVTCIK